MRGSTGGGREIISPDENYIKDRPELHSMQVGMKEYQFESNIITTLILQQGPIEHGYDDEM